MTLPQGKPRTVDSMPLEALPPEFGKLVAKKVNCEKQDARHANIGFGNGWVTADSLISKGAYIHMHFFKKTNFVLSS